MKTFFYCPLRLGNNVNFKHEHPAHTSGFLHYCERRTGSFFSPPPMGDYHRTSTNRRSQTAPTSIPPPLALRPNPENSSYIHRRAYGLQVSRKRANENHDRTQTTSPHLSQNTTAAFFALIGRWQPDTRAHIADNSSSGNRFELWTARELGEAGAHNYEAGTNFTASRRQKQTDSSICTVIPTSAALQSQQRIHSRPNGCQVQASIAARHTFVH